MRLLYARYLLFAAARETVKSTGAAIVTLVAEDAPAVEHDVERVERVPMKSAVGPDFGEVYPRKTKTEPLSYPISRIIISPVETPVMMDKYARVEVDTLYEHMFVDFDVGDDNVHDEIRVSLDSFLREFNLGGVVWVESNWNRNNWCTPGNYWVDVGSYLTYSDIDWSVGWRLVNRPLADGAVRVTREELPKLLCEAIHHRVAGGLPFAVCGSDTGNRLADALRPHAEHPRNLLSDRGMVNVVYVNAVDPDYFSPCAGVLLAWMREDESFPDEAAFALTAFLVGVGLDLDEVGGVVGDETTEVL